MYQYRQVLVRMRLGDSNREIASSRLMGRKKASALRSLAEEEGWLEGPLPDDETLAERLGRPAQRLSSESLVEPYRDDVTKWRAEGVQGTTIHRVLKEVHRFGGSYSSVQRFLQKLGDREPAATVILDFAPGDTAQVDFGRGPRFPVPAGSRNRRGCS